jgi:hypothetical protein
MKKRLTSRPKLSAVTRAIPVGRVQIRVALAEGVRRSAAARKNAGKSAVHG